MTKLSIQAPEIINFHKYLSTAAKKHFLPAISILAFFEVIKLGYVMGCVTAMYRSSDITTKCKMDAVHIQTSTASQIEHL